MERERLPLPAFTRLAPPPDFSERLRAHGVAIDAERLGTLGDYLALLLAMNERLNLTAILEETAAWERHILDALTLLPHLAPLAATARVADLGSGGGVPALPLAIARPDLAFTLIESTQKKCAFLEDAAHALSLTNVTVVAERAETVGKGPLRGTFDAVTARALARLELLVPLAAPLLGPLGKMHFIKGQRADEELAGAAKVLRQKRIRHVETHATPTGRIVLLEKLPSL